jgi:hypothetical protein
METAVIMGTSNCISCVIGFNLTTYIYGMHGRSKKKIGLRRIKVEK